MSEDLNEQVVVAFFDSIEAADSAADAIMSWDDANDDIKLGTIARLTQGEKGKLQTKRYGDSRTKRGALIGGAIGLVAGVLTGGLSLIGGALIGGALGGVGGSVAKGSLGLTEEGLENIKQHLDAGRSALVVLCDSYELEATMAELSTAGGTPQSFGVSAEVLHALHENQLNAEHEETVVRQGKVDIAPTVTY